MYRLIFILPLLCMSLCMQGGSITGTDHQEEYEKLSQLSSDELLDQGRLFFERREAGNALSRFLILGERYGPDSPQPDLQKSIRALNNAGCVYKYLYYDYPQAYEYFKRAYDLSVSSGYEEFLPTIMVNLGDLLNDYARIYNSESFSREAEQVFNQCYDQAVKTGDWELLTTAFYNLSNFNYDIDLSRYTRILSDDIPADTPDIAYVRLQYHGIENIQKKQYDLARSFFLKQPETINTKWEAQRDTISSLINVAKTYQLEADGLEATRYLKQALAIAEKDSLIDLSGFIASELAQTYRSLGDSVAFARYHNLYLEKLELLNNKRLSNVADLKYISEIKAQETMAREQALLNRTYRYISLALVAILLTILVSLAAIWRKNRKLKSRNLSLFENYQRLVAAEEAGAKETKYKHSNLDDAKREALAARIRAIMDDPDTICSADFSLKQLAELADSNTTYVSQIINESFGVTFNTLLGSSRVRVVCHRINETSMYANLTIEAIANSVGFKSRTAFINAFKREVGLTPSEYIKMAGS